MASFNFNKVLLGGRLTSAPELKQTPNGVPVCTFGIAVNRKATKGGTSEADFFNCTAWRGTGEFVSKYFSKGSSIFVVGTLQNRTWTDSNGQKRYATDIVVDEANFVDSKNEAQGNNVANNGYIPQSYTAPTFNSTAPSAVSIEDLSASDDLPF